MANILENLRSRILSRGRTTLNPIIEDNFFTDITDIDVDPMLGFSYVVESAKKSKSEAPLKLRVQETEEQTVVEEANEVDDIEEVDEDFEPVQFIEPEEDVQFSLHDILMIILNHKYDPQKLLEGDYNAACPELVKYIDSIDMESYSGVIFNLMKIDQINHDYTYSGMLAELTQLSDPFYEFNLASYLRIFFQSFSNRDLRIARLYLDVLKESGKLEDGTLENLGATIDSIEYSRKEKNKSFEISPANSQNDKNGN